MAVYSSGREGTEYLTLQVTRTFKVFDMVEITLRDDRTINGEIVYIEKYYVFVTGPYLPIEKIPLKEILDISPWNPPEEWK